MEVKQTRDVEPENRIPSGSLAKPRLATIDIAKGLGILLIVLGHNRIFSIYEINLANFLGSFRLPFFFFISGVTFSIANRSLNTVAFERADAWLKPFAVAAVMAGGLKILVGKVTLESVLLGLFFGAGFTLIWTAIWFLPHLWLLYVSTASLLIYGKRWVDTWPKRIMLLVGLATAGYFLMDSFHTVLENPSCKLKTQFEWSVFDCGLPFSADLLLLTASFFLFGHFLSVRVKAFKPDTALVLLCFGLLLLLHLTFGYRIDFNMRRYDDLFISTVQALSGIYMMLCACFLLVRSGFATRIFTYLGQGSLFILLFHMPIQYRVTDTLVMHMNSQWLVGLIGFVVAIVLPLLFWELCKKSRMLSLLFLPVKKSKTAASCQPLPAVAEERSR
jgi:fucose 4-O-acetylase-like acetyltransferase